MPVPSAAGKPWEGMDWRDEGTPDFRESLSEEQADEWRNWQYESQTEAGEPTPDGAPDSSIGGDEYEPPTDPAYQPGSGGRDAQSWDYDSLPEPPPATASPEPEVPSGPPDSTGQPWDGMDASNVPQEFEDSLSEDQWDEYEKWRDYHQDLKKQEERANDQREQDEHDARLKREIEEETASGEIDKYGPPPGGSKTVAFVDDQGNPLDAVVKDQPIHIQVTVPRGAGESPPNTIEVLVSGTQTTLGIEYQGTESVTLTWTRNVVGPAIYRSDVLTIEKGGGGAGSVGAGGFEFAIGSMDGFAPDEGDVIQVGYGGAISGVRVFTSTTKLELTFTLAAIGAMNQMYTNVLVNLNGLEQELANATDVTNKAEIQAQIDLLQGSAQQGLGLTQRAIAYTNNPNLLDHQKLAVAQLYGNWIGVFQQPTVSKTDGSAPRFGPVFVPDPRDEGDFARDASTQAKEEVKTIMWRGLGQATIGGYRLLAHATLAAQVMTLFGTTEMGKTATFEDKWGAFWDLVTQAALAGAMIKWNHGNIVGQTTARIPRVKPVTDQPTAMGAPSGTPVTPEAAGMLREAGFDAQMVVRARDVQVQVRLTGPDAMVPRAQGALPKSMDLKSKTIREIDREIGAPDSAVNGSPGLFEPRLPTRGNRTDAEWTAIQERYQLRKDEWEGPLGDYTRKLVGEGKYQLRDGMVTGPNGEIIAGDYDLFEISNLDGTPASPELYDAVVGDLMAANGFQAAHGAHMRWNPRADDPNYHIDFSADLDTSLQGMGKWWADRNIFRNIIARHQPGGEGMITFAPNRPPVITYAGEVVAPKFAELGITVPNTTPAGPNIFIQPPTLYFATTQQLLDGRYPDGQGWDWTGTFDWKAEVGAWETQATALGAIPIATTPSPKYVAPPLIVQTTGGFNWRPIAIGGALVLALAGGGFVLLNQPPGNNGVAAASPTDQPRTQPPVATDPPTQPPIIVPPTQPTVPDPNMPPEVVFDAVVAAGRVDELTGGIILAPPGWHVETDGMGDMFVFGPSFPPPAQDQPWADLVGAGAFPVTLDAGQATAVSNAWACPPGQTPGLIVFCNQDLPLEAGDYVFVLTAWEALTPDRFGAAALCSWATQTDQDGDPTNGFDSSTLPGHPLTGSDVYFEGVWFINAAGVLQHYLLATDYREPVRADTGGFQGNLSTTARAVRPDIDQLPVSGRNFVDFALLVPAGQFSDEVFGAHGYCATDRGNLSSTVAIDVLGDVAEEPDYMYPFGNRLPGE